MKITLSIAPTKLSQPLRLAGKRSVPVAIAAKKISCVLATEATQVPAPAAGDFDPMDFDPADFAT